MNANIVNQNRNLNFLQNAQQQQQPQQQQQQQLPPPQQYQLQLQQQQQQQQQQNQQHQQQQQQFVNQDVDHEDNDEDEEEDDEDDYSDYQGQQNQQEAQMNPIQPMTETQMKEEINQFFNLYINPILIFGSLTAITFESNEQVFYNQLLYKSYDYLSLFFYFSVAVLYIFTFSRSLKQSQFRWEHFRFVNYFGIFGIGCLSAFYLLNMIFQQRYFDQRWSRMMISLLVLSQYTHFMIHKLYGEFDISLPTFFNRIYYLVIPLSDYEKENAFVSLTEIYVKLKMVCQPLSLVYFLIQIIYHMKMYKWSPSISTLSPPVFDAAEYGREQYLWIALDQLRTIQMFTVLLICGLITVGCSQYIGIPHEHYNRLPYILIFLYYTTYIMTYKVYLTAQILSGGWINLEKILVPIFIITLVPISCTLFLKRALTKLYRLPTNDQEQMEQNQIELFASFKLEFPRNYQDPPAHVTHIFARQTQMYNVVNFELFGICLILFIYQFVNINQLYTQEQQFSIGLQIQGIYDCIIDLAVYIFIILTIVYQALNTTTETILNQTEYGIFSFLFIIKYIINLHWNFISLLSMFILTSYIMNVTEYNTTFHVGPAISLLWMLLIYSIKTGVLPNLIYDYVKAVKFQFQTGQNQQQQQNNMNNLLIRINNNLNNVNILQNQLANNINNNNNNNNDNNNNNNQNNNNINNNNNMNQNNNMNNINNVIVNY